MGDSLLVVIMVMAILLRLTITGELSLILLNWCNCHTSTGILYTRKKLSLPGQLYRKVL